MSYCRIKSGADTATAGDQFPHDRNRPGTTEELLRHFLAETHSSMRNLKSMPNPKLNDDQIRQAVAFLMSLRTRR